MPGASGASGDSGAERAASIVRAQARDALVGLGWRPAIARAAVDEAWFHVGPDVAIEPLIREALRRCPTAGRPRGDPLIQFLAAILGGVVRRCRR